MKKILNVGSLNIDYVYQVPHFVQPGETLSSTGYARHPGGKGLNQSIALARAGAVVHHVGHVGADGAWLVDFLKSEGAGTSHLTEVDGPTGHAIIQVNAEGQNCILIEGGANRRVTVADAAKAVETLGFVAGDYMLLQNETSAVRELIALGVERGLKVVFNPAPMDKSIREITRMIADLFDIVYFSARKFGFGRGGGIMIRDEEMFHAMEDYITMFEGFLTYGGMSVKEMEALIIGFEETMDMDIISQGPIFINHCVKELDKLGVPMVTPGGGLGAHIDARQVVDHIPAEQYPAGSLVAALYLCGGIRGMERGTLSEERNPDGTEHIASVEMVRLAFPRRVFTLSQTEYVIDRVKWLYDHRHLIGGLRFVHEPKTLRFFTGKLEPVSDWPEKLMEAYIADFGEEN